MPIRELEQLTIEDKYSRHNIRRHILDDIEGSALDKIINKGEKLLNKWLQGSYYTSKNNRLAEFSNECKLTIRELIVEIMVIILPLQGAQTIQSIAGRVGNLLNMEDVFDSVKTASEILAVLCETNLYDIAAAKNSTTGSLTIKSNYSLEEETLQYLSNTKYLPPLICKPQEITSNFSSGYLSKEESVILGKGNHHHKNQALDVLNIASTIELSLDTNILGYEETSKKPLDTPEKVNNFRRMVNSSKIVYKELQETGNRFYLTYKYDKRGRLYSQGYHVNIQSTSFKKALINLAKKEVIQGAP